MTGGSELSSYLIDECGHGGDLASARALDFSGQPVFALACIGAPDPAMLAGELERLRRVHGCGPGELKSTMARLPQFTIDLASFLKRNHCPIFIELVDKRFFIAAHIVNHLLCGGLNVDAVPMPVRNAIAEFLTDEALEPVFLDYLTLCRDPAIGGVRQILDCLWERLDTSDDDIARLTQYLTMEARDRALSVSAELADFLPLHDQTEAGRKVWILPNLQSLTNIYARINQSRPLGLNGATLIHDVQLQYGSILSGAKVQMEQLAELGAIPPMPFADYRLSGRAEMRFETAAREPCLQAADILAGCAMRFAREAGAARVGKAAVMRDAFFALLALSRPERAEGVNLVFTYRTLARMGVPVHDMR
ncbi:MAG: hypothetical protein IE932_01305 [Sphingopyxis terrae]|nr:hypothetical protein [Sphingopyxis terrae]